MMIVRRRETVSKGRKREKKDFLATSDDVTILILKSQRAANAKYIDKKFSHSVQ
jgi:hypothetical protein